MKNLSWIAQKFTKNTQTLLLCTPNMHLILKLLEIIQKFQIWYFVDKMNNFLKTK